VNEMDEVIKENNEELDDELNINEELKEKMKEIDDEFEIEGNSSEQGSFLTDEGSKESIPKVSGEIEIATPDERFRGNSKRTGSDVKRKNKNMAEFKKQIRKENRLKKYYSVIKFISKFIKNGTNNFIMKIFGLFDSLLNAALILSLLVAVYFGIIYIIKGDYLMVAACCVFIITVSYVNEKVL
jgi:hypothetical protein